MPDRKAISLGAGALTVLVALLAADLSAQDSTSTRMYFDVPLLDFGYQSLAMRTAANHRNSLGAGAHAAVGLGDFLDSYANPSMQQSLGWSASRITLTGHGINRLSDAVFDRSAGLGRVLNQGMRELLFTAGNAFLIYFPIGDGWVHEEYHRAVLTTGGVHSYDNLDSFNALGEGHVSVTKIRDQDLAYFKATDPIGFNRMLVAGGEGEVLLTRDLQLDNFYYGSGVPITLYDLLITYTVASYPNNDASDSDAAELLEREAEETQVTERDFTGPDYRGWAWHLFKPDVPYDSLGAHPSGTGIDRYVSYGELTGEELSFLKQAGHAMWLNLVSPMTVGIYRIRLGGDRDANFAIRTVLNGFGYDINPELYLRTPTHRVFVGLHRYRNFDRSFFGAEAGTYRSSAHVLGRGLQYDARLMLWSQPGAQAFKTTSASLGGFVGGRVYYPMRDWLQGYVDVAAKSDGWVAGNPFLTRNVSAGVGLSMQLER